ncbi:MAG: poly(hydroxyalkanoate) granule-associated protein [Chloroflexi bacterium]|nr:poly(hydroxyalkanoate) granule-associated protein [Chloroflexota bacterium]
MSEEQKTNKKRTGEETPEADSLFGSARKVLLASVGAAALAQEEIEDFVTRLVDKGEIAEKDGRKLVKDVLERRRKRAERFGEVVDEGLERVLSLLNLPTKGDITELSERVAELSRQVEELQKTQ